MLTAREIIRSQVCPTCPEKAMSLVLDIIGQDAYLTVDSEGQKVGNVAFPIVGYRLTGEGIVVYLQGTHGQIVTAGLDRIRLARAYQKGG